MLMEESIKQTPSLSGSDAKRGEETASESNKPKMLVRRFCFMAIETY